MCGIDGRHTFWKAVLCLLIYLPDTLIMAWHPPTYPSRHRFSGVRMTAERSSHTPFVVVNKISGGGKGTRIWQAFRELLPREQVCELRGEGLELKHSLKLMGPRLSNLRVLCCGGDGTQGWLLSSMHNASLSPPIAPLPSGTGNDLARTLGWGGHEGSWRSMQRSATKWLEDLAAAEEVQLDTWKLAFQGNAGSAASESRMMLNYIGIGVDAAVCLAFHNTRHQLPALHASRKLNKMWYGWHATKTLFKSGLQLDKRLTIKCDGNLVPIPRGTGSVVVLNGDSYMGGASAWGRVTPGDQYDPNSPRDGKLEVVAVSSVIHLLTILLGLQSGTRLAQGNRLEVQSNSPLAVQIDGEPMTAEAGVMNISYAGEITMLQKMKSARAIGPVLFSTARRVLLQQLVRMARVLGLVAAPKK